MKTYNQISDEERDAIRGRVDNLIETLSRELDICVEAVGNTAFMRVQKHPEWGRNATDAHKAASYSARKGICERCRQPVEVGQVILESLLTTDYWQKMLELCA